MEEVGLAAQQYGEASGTGSNKPVTVEELVQLLMSGITPQQLVEAGVPQELVQQAMAMAKQMSQTAAGPVGQGGVPMSDDGLAAQAAMMGA